MADHDLSTAHILTASPYLPMARMQYVTLTLNVVDTHDGRVKVMMEIPVLDKMKSDDVVPRDGLSVVLTVPVQVGLFSFTAPALLNMTSNVVDTGV